MILNAAKPLFAWDCLEHNTALADIRKSLQAIPDHELLQALRDHRGHGRDDYPVAVLWGTFLLTIILRHITVEACLGELRRNDPLATLIGIEHANDVPTTSSMSRFLEVLGLPQHLTLLRQIHEHMVTRLGLAVPDLGQDLAGDSAHLNARRSKEHKSSDTHVAQDDAPKDSKSAKQEAKPNNGTPMSQDDAHKDSGSAKQEAKATKQDSKPTKIPLPLIPDDTNQPIRHADDKIDKHGLPLPSGGKKDYHDEQGRVTHTLSWFGFKIHQLVDVKHEITLAYQITSPKVGDNHVIGSLLTQAQRVLPEDRIRTLAYDKAADDIKVHELLHEQGIKPLIHIRSQWKEESEQMLPGHDGTSNIVYDEAGTVFCYDKVSNPPVRHEMAYAGHEAERGTLKYRCPAKHQGFDCPMSKICNEGLKYGKTVRVNQEIDLRRFPSIPRATQQFEERYKGRTAVERVNARLKVFWGVDDGNVTGSGRFHAHVAGVMIVQAAFATLLAGAPRREGTLGKASLTPIGRELQKPVSESNSET